MTISHLPFLFSLSHLHTLIGFTIYDISQFDVKVDYVSSGIYSLGRIHMFNHHTT